MPVPQRRSVPLMRNALLFTLICILAAPMAAAQQRSTYDPHVVVVQFEPSEMIVEGSNNSGLPAFDQAAAPFIVHEIERVFPFLDYVQPTPRTRLNLLALRRTYYVRFQANDSPQIVANRLTGTPGVVYAEPVLVNRTLDLDARGLVDPSDSLFSDQTYLRHLRLTEAWDEVKGENGAPPVVIAVVDGGGDWRHEDLRNNVWTNTDEIPDNGADDDNNGFIDDVHGVNFVNGDATNNDPTGMAQAPRSFRHGTAVAGIASAVTDNSAGIAGAAWNADLMHINVACSMRDGGICFGYEGILYAAANGADIINTSWGGAKEEGETINYISQVLDLATDMGSLVVASASNDNLNNDLYPYYPARHPRVLSVGATTKDARVKAPFSNFGKLVDVFAPGEYIQSTTPEDRYGFERGTSSATALVAGVAALVKTKFPEISPDSLREQVRLASESMAAENPVFAGHLGRGYVNALEALAEPSMPAIRIRHWSWSDLNDDSLITSGDQVTITATIVNYLADAQQLVVSLAAAEPYPFIDVTTSRFSVGSLAGGDSTEVSFKFTVSSGAPANQRIRFYFRMLDGAYEDEADMMSLGINRNLDGVLQALSALYTATDGDNWTSSENWDITTLPTEDELVEWQGVFLSEGWLLGLSMPENNLAGTLPGELGDLVHLLWLNMSENALSGDIPSELASLSMLRELNLYGNSLTGSIPASVSSLAQLGKLNLGRNSLSGSIPAELGNLLQLRDLRLSRNFLTGGIPSVLGNLTALETLHLYGNTLTGRIPIELGNLIQLRDLRVSRNTLTGAIPSQIGNLAALEILHLHGSSLSGNIPGELGNLVQLLDLRLSENLFSGRIPDQMGNLTQVQRLSLHLNFLTGAIPSAFGNLVQLRDLRMSDNSLSGAVPAELGNLTQLRRLNLHSNSLSGVIPNELGNLSQMEELTLHDNDLTGQLPRTMMQLTNLQVLQFGGQDLCAPQDSAFQAWLGSIPDYSGPTCNELLIAGSIDDQIFTEGVAITPYVFPKAVGGDAPYTYSLDPALPAGLVFDDTTRTITGAPTMISDHATYTYTATDANAATASLAFGIEVVSAVSFASSVADQSFARAQPIAPLVLPAAMGGAPPISYALIPALPAGLTIDTTTRTISGTPTVVTASTPYTFRATGTNGTTDSLMFRIEVYSPTDAQREALPVAFALHGNYPNPFQRTTQIVFDLPWRADVTVDVLDVLGRRMFALPSKDIAGGWSRSISLSGVSLPAGVYLYRVHASSPEGNRMHVGRFARIK